MNVLTTEIFDHWFNRLKDKTARNLVTARINRLAYDLFGDVKSVGDKVFEHRIHYGPGFRIYFCIRGTEVIILLLGGDKSSQERDIARAKQLAEDLKNGYEIESF